VQGFVVSETKYAWGAAIPVPGLAALNAGGNAVMSSLSCWSAGDCVAGGSYQSSTSLSDLTGSYPVQAFVVSERFGVWHAAEEVPGTSVLNSATDAQVNSVSCAPGGYCAAGGFYEFNTGGPWYPAPFVASAKNGRWASAQIPPLTKALTDGFYQPIVALSCPQAASCTAIGYEWELGPGNVSGQWQAWSVTQKNGVWGSAEALPDLGMLSLLSCSSAGNCAATSGPSVAAESNGRWGKPEEVPGLAALDRGGNAAISSISCPSATHCVAVGYYTDSKGHAQAFVGGT
jgi:hypothetical protein